MNDTNGADANGDGDVVGVAAWQTKGNDEQAQRVRAEWMDPVWFQNEPSGRRRVRHLM